MEHYSWIDACDIARKARQNRSSKLERYESLRNCVILNLNRKWTPEEISGRMFFENCKMYVCHQSIYTYIEKHPELKSLLRNYKRKRYVNNHCIKKKLKNLPNIRDREDGDSIYSWEADLVSYGKKTPENVTTLFNRCSKYVRLVKNENGRSETVLRGIYAHKRGIKILTMDRGVEFLDVKSLKKHGIKPWYCDPMSPWQKGGCENSNGRLRWWLPRGTDIEKVSQEDLDKISENMNNTPRKSIGYMTPKEFYELIRKWCTSS
jgi:IS30 family transposase